MNARCEQVLAAEEAVGSGSRFKVERS